MHPKSAAKRRPGMHSAQILPGRGPFRCTDPLNHARHANLAILCRRTALALAASAPPNSASARNPCATAPSGHSGHRQQHQRRHPPAEQPRRKRSRALQHRNAARGQWRRSAHGPRHCSAGATTSARCRSKAQRKSLAAANPYATHSTAFAP